ncbi:unnamed protein product [Victoria cruziana]
MSSNRGSSVEIPVVAVSRQRRAASDSHGPYSNDQRRWVSCFPLWSYQPEIMIDPWSRFEERVRNGPFGLTGFPVHPHSPVYILTIGDPAAEGLNPRLLNFVRESQPRVLREHRHLTLPADRPAAALTGGELNSVMKKMKKKVYRPKSTSMFSKNTNKGKKQNDNGEDEECSICLEKFVPGHEVLITPCNHMFHGDCLQPWVKSHGKCPICRMAFSERSDELSVANAHMGDSDNDNILSLIGAMEEAFAWINRRY